MSKVQGAELETAVGLNVLIYLSILRFRSPNFMWAFSQPFWIRSYKKKLAQPQSGLSRGYQAKTVRNTLSPCHKCQKKKNFCCMFIQNFCTLTTVFMDSKNSFRPNLLDLERKFDFGISMTPLWPLTIVHPKSRKMAKLAF